MLQLRPGDITAAMHAPCFTRCSSDASITLPRRLLAQPLQQPRSISVNKQQVPSACTTPPPVSLSASGSAPRTKARRVGITDPIVQSLVMTPPPRPEFPRLRRPASLFPSQTRRKHHGCYFQPAAMYVIRFPTVGLVSATRGGGPYLSMTLNAPWKILLTV